jgi:hypothetical protein
MVPSVASEKIPSDTTGDFFFVLCILCVLLCPDCPGFAFCPYSTTHTTQTSMPAAGFEPAILASDRPQTLVLDCSATVDRSSP